MSSLDGINEYVTAVCRQIRWKKARFRVAEEMTKHILDGRDSYMAQEMDEKAATETAIAETGDATDIGSKLDRIHRPKPQWRMFAATAILLALGFLSRMYIFDDGSRVGLLGVQLVSVGIGIAGMIAAYLIDFTIIGKYPKTIYWGVLSISIVLLLLSPLENGRMLFAQYAVLLFPLAFSAIIFVTRNKGYWGIVLCGLAFALLGFIALYTSYASGFLHFAVVGAMLLGIAICKKWFAAKRIYSFLLMLVPIALLTIVVCVSMPSSGWHRLAVAFNPSIDPNGTGYMGVITRELLSDAKLFGIGNIPDAYAGLMESNSYFYTDLLLTALIARLGWIAFAVIVGALLFFIVKGFMLCFKQKSSLGLFVSAAIMLMFCMQVIIYMAFNLGFQFGAPISLPLISYGNKATAINLVLIGFMLSVFRTGDLVSDKKASPVTKRNNFICWSDGILTINFKPQ